MVHFEPTSSGSASRRFLYQLFAISFLVALRCISGPTAVMSYFLLAGLAMFGYLQALQALALCWLFNMLSAGIAPEVPGGATLRFFVLASAAISVFGRGGLRIHRFPALTVALGLAIILHSLLFSVYPVVSVLKAGAWMTVVATTLCAWLRLDPSQHLIMSRQLYRGLIAVGLAGLPLIALPVGYLRNGTGFQGILNHPQALGPVMGFLTVLATIRVVCAGTPQWSSFIVAGGAGWLVLMSEARTAGLAVIIGLTLALSLGPIAFGQPWSSLAPGLKSSRVRWLLFGASLTAIVFYSDIGVLGTDFMFKSGRSDASSLLEAYADSRGGLVGDMVSNIQSHPWAGIGFGIASSPATMEVIRDPLLGLPVAAPIEKGVAFIAVVEELGILLGGAVFLWALLLTLRAVKGGIGPLAIVLTALLFNMGEATLFSTGGFGLLSIMMFGWALSVKGTPRRDRP